MQLLLNKTSTSAIGIIGFSGSYILALLGVFVLYLFNCFIANPFTLFIIYFVPLPFCIIVSLLLVRIRKGFTTEHDRAQEIANQINLYQELLNNMPDVVCQLDDKGNVTNINKSGEELFEAKRSEVIGNNVKNYVHPDDQEKSRRHFELLRSEGYYEKYEGRIVTSKANVRWIQVSSILIKDKGAIIGSQDIIRDITPTKELELSLKQSQQKLQELIKSKDKLLSIIAHDLRNPFNGILGITEILIHNGVKTSELKLQHLLNSLHLAASNTYNLLCNLLEWALSQQGKVPFQPEEINFFDVVSEIVKNTSSLAEVKGININKRVDVDLQVVADRNMVAVVIRNLITNAIKYTPDGGEIAISAIKNKEELLIKVADTGVGISDTHLDTLFDSNNTKITPGTKNEKGTGLGLILCKEFIEKHNGKIWVKSEPGKGSEFNIALPLIEN